MPEHLQRVDHDRPAIVAGLRPKRGNRIMGEDSFHDLSCKAALVAKV